MSKIVQNFIILLFLLSTAEPNPMLSSVLARNGSFLSVQVTWSLTAHGVFSAARVVSLKLRLLSSSEWSHQISSISQEYALYKFEHLEPSSVYILNITLHNKDKQSESRAVVFWSAASNASGTRIKRDSVFCRGWKCYAERIAKSYIQQKDNNYLTNLIFSVRTVSYGSSFYLFDLSPARFALGP